VAIREMRLATVLWEGFAGNFTLDEVAVPIQAQILRLG